jgi:tetratricopeptide (TPR) repeat protein
MRSSWLLFFLFLVVISLTRAASAQSKKASEETVAAKKHFQAGTSYFESAEYGDAEREFLRALKLSGRVDLLYNIARCQEMMGKLDEAIESVNKYIVGRPDDPQGLRLLTRLQTMKIEREKMKTTGGSEPPAAEPTPSTPPPEAVVAKSPPEKPITKKAWFWGAVGGGIAAAALVVGLGVGLGAVRDPIASIGAVEAN